MGFVTSLFSTGPDTGNITTQSNQVTHANAQYNNNQDLQDALKKQALGLGGPQEEVFNNSLSQAQNAGASTIASQKGINTGLAARLAGQQSGQMAQQAVGQRATNQLQAQQVYGQNIQGQQQIAQNAIAGQNNAMGGLQQSYNQQQGQMMGGLFNGAGALGAAAMNKGGVVPGSPEVAGDSLENDTVPTNLSPGEIVIPRSAAKDPDKAKAFIDALSAKSKSEGTAKGYGKVLEAHKKLGEMLKSMKG